MSIQIHKIIDITHKNLCLAQIIFINFVYITYCKRIENVIVYRWKEERMIQNDQTTNPDKINAKG